MTSYWYYHSLCRDEGRRRRRRRRRSQNRELNIYLSHSLQPLVQLYLPIPSATLHNMDKPPLSILSSQAVPFTCRYIQLIRYMAYQLTCFSWNSMLRLFHTHLEILLVPDWRNEHVSGGTLRRPCERTDLPVLSRSQGSRGVPHCQHPPYPPSHTTCQLPQRNQWENTATAGNKYEIINKVKKK